MVGMGIDYCGWDVIRGLVEVEVRSAVKGPGDLVNLDSVSLWRHNEHWTIGSCVGGAGWWVLGPAPIMMGFYMVLVLDL